MENNKLIKTDTIWYKIKKFLYNIFNKKENNNKKEEKNVQKHINNKFQESISVKKEIDKQNRKEKLALNLINADIDINDLTDEEVNEMIEWFKEDIEKQDNELKRIKAHILQIRKELEE